MQRYARIADAARLEVGEDLERDVAESLAQDVLRLCQPNSLDRDGGGTLLSGHSLGGGYEVRAQRVEYVLVDVLCAQQTDRDDDHAL